MRDSPAVFLTTSILTIVGVGLLLLWTLGGFAGPFEPSLREPGMDGAPPTGRPGYTEAPVAGEPVLGDGTPADIPGTWPWFRGPNLDAICDDGIRLTRKWPPKELWRVEMGPGYAAPAVQNGRVYVLDYVQDDTMRCLSLADGKEIWRNSYPVVVPWNHGMSRTVAALVDNYVISFGPKCHVVCWDAETGRSLWLLDLVLDYQATVPTWYAGQCPLIDDDRLILAPGGDALVIAVDYKTGEVIWESPNPRNWAMTHSSIVPMEFAGRKTYVYCGSGGVAGVSADDGSPLWDTTAWKIRAATCPSPVVLPGDRLFLCGGYNAGAMILQLNEQGGQWTAETVARLKPAQFSSEQQTPVLYGGYLYGVRQQDDQLVCLDPNGKQEWSSGDDKFGSGPYMIADGAILVMDDEGRLTMVEATPTGYRRLARAQVIDDAMHSWGPMALVAGRLIVRDMTRMVCLDLREEQ